VTARGFASLASLAMGPLLAILGGACGGDGVIDLLPAPLVAPVEPVEAAASASCAPAPPPPMKAPADPPTKTPRPAPATCADSGPCPKMMMPACGPTPPMGPADADVLDASLEDAAAVTP